MAVVHTGLRATALERSVNFKLACMTRRTPQLSSASCHSDRCRANAAVSSAYQCLIYCPNPLTAGYLHVYVITPTCFGYYNLEIFQRKFSNELFAFHTGQNVEVRRWRTSPLGESSDQILRPGYCTSVVQNRCSPHCFRGSTEPGPLWRTMWREKADKDILHTVQN